MTDLKMVSINVSPLIRAGSNETPAKISKLSCQRGRGHWAVKYTSPQSFKIQFSNSLHWINNFGEF